MTGKYYDVNGNITGEFKNDNKIPEEKHYHQREYGDYGEVIFDGEYLNGKRNGKGKEYWTNGKISFEGEYLNGKEWIGTSYDPFGNKRYELKNNDNFCQEYNFRGILIFEGECLNKKRNGKGKEYYNDGKLRFEGEYLYDYKLRGKFYIDDKLEYEGEYLYIYMIIN